MRAREFTCPPIANPHYTKKAREISPCISKNNYFLYISIFQLSPSEMKQYTTQYEIARNFSIYNHKNWQPAIKVEICPIAFSQFRHISFHLHISPSEFVDCYQG